MIKAVLFDLDGTLADTAPDLAHALNRQRVARGMPPLPLATIRPHVSKGGRGLVNVGFGAMPDESDFHAIRDEFLMFYAERMCHETTLFPGMADLLDELERRGLPWGVVTNKFERFTLPLLAALALDERAASIISGDTCSRAKPHPDSLLAACEQIGVAPKNCVYVGDDERDVQAAHAAGMMAIVAMYGYLGDDNHPEAWGADAMIEQPAEVLNYL